MSLFEIIGGYSVVLILVAIMIGLAALVIRRRQFSVFSTCIIVGIAFAGLGATFWNLSVMNRMQLVAPVGVDPSRWLADFGASCARAGSVLPACGISMLLIGLSFLFQKAEQKKNRE